ncbi:uncharacterized protein N7482_004118 [Penicillium canariense]|uniref:Uncharacterized protein n=1 Tax=Penicillium canariense TaxID=189055 RepID=A0A9W9I5U0_9EURO|nr:uncharacterized protein N7482_004118 [Penicillium canariense]KAJ5168524.1 hypothetical protein N7482_004118 [Penicillium canariense]
MFGAIKNWFSPAQENENKWDAHTVQLQQPNSPAGPTMNNETVTEQPGDREEMSVHMRGGGEGEDVCCGV